MSRVEDEVCRLIQQRADMGLSKYGKTMERDDLSLIDWHKHRLEELLDAAVYTMRIIMDMQQAPAPQVKQCCRNCVFYRRCLPGEYEFCPKLNGSILGPVNTFCCQHWQAL